jgi:putative transposase
MRSKRIRVYPQAQQRTEWTTWLDASRWCYNKTVEILKEEYADKRTPSWMDLSKDVLAQVPQRLADAPFQVKKIAVRDAVSALAVGKKKVALGLLPRFELQFRSRKDPRQSCFIPSSAIKESGIYPRISGAVEYREAVPDVPSDSRLVRLRGRWTLCVPYRKEVARTETQGRVIALDPGIRTFMAFFALTPQTEQFGHLGAGDFSRIVRLLVHADKLSSRIDREKSRGNARRARNMGRALDRIKNKVSDLVEEMHHKIAYWLVDNYDIILLPTFETSDMVVRGRRKLRKKSVRAMLTLRHYEFAQHLENKAQEYGKLVLRVDEAYTSKTVSWTGEIKHSLGGARRIKVGAVWVDRDINGARGILLRALVDTPALRDLVTCVEDEHVNVC